MPPPSAHPISAPGSTGTGANPFTQNGVNNYATFGVRPDLSFGATNDFSIAFWARLPTNGWSGASYTEPPFISNENFLDLRQSRLDAGRYFGPGGRLEFHGSCSTRRSIILVRGTFGNPVQHHVAVTFQRGGNAIAYVDGVPPAPPSPGGHRLRHGSALPAIGTGDILPQHGDGQRPASPPTGWVDDLGTSGAVR